MIKKTLYSLILTCLLLANSATHNCSSLSQIAFCVKFLISYNGHMDKITRQETLRALQNQESRLHQDLIDINGRLAASAANTPDHDRLRNQRALNLYNCIRIEGQIRNVRHELNNLPCPSPCAYSHFHTCNR